VTATYERIHSKRERANTTMNSSTLCVAQRCSTWSVRGRSGQSTSVAAETWSRSRLEAFNRGADTPFASDANELVADHDVHQAQPYALVDDISFREPLMQTG